MTTQAERLRDAERHTKKYHTDPIFAEAVRSKHRHWYLANKEYAKARGRAYYAAGKEQIKASRRYRNAAFQERLRQHNITLDQYAAMDESQDWLCAICRNERSLHIDHDHSTGQFRGLLCGSCNRGLGLFDESTESLANSIRYLQGI